MDADKTGGKCGSRRSKVQTPLHESCIRCEAMRRLFSLHISVYQRSSAVKRITNHERLRVCEVRRRRTKQDPGFTFHAMSLRRRRYTRKMAIRDTTDRLDGQQNSLQRLRFFLKAQSRGSDHVRSAMDLEVHRTCWKPGFGTTGSKYSIRRGDFTQCHPRNRQPRRQTTRSSKVSHS